MQWQENNTNLPTTLHRLQHMQTLTIDIIHRKELWNLELLSWYQVVMLAVYNIITCYGLHTITINTTVNHDLEVI